MQDLAKIPNAASICKSRQRCGRDCPLWAVCSAGHPSREAYEEAAEKAATEYMNSTKEKE